MSNQTSPPDNSEHAKAESSNDRQLASDAMESLIDPETRKNKTKIVCTHCGSSILMPMAGVHSKQEPSIRLPLERQKKELAKSVDTMEYESMADFWLVHDMFTFENIGFTNTVDNRKYLICADCEVGPVGVQSLDKPNEFLLCVNRVKHVP